MIIQVNRALRHMINAPRTTLGALWHRLVVISFSFHFFSNLPSSNVILTIVTTFVCGRHQRTDAVKVIWSQYCFNRSNGQWNHQQQVHLKNSVAHNLSGSQSMLELHLVGWKGEKKKVYPLGTKSNRQQVRNISTKITLSEWRVKWWNLVRHLFRDLLSLDQDGSRPGVVWVLV